MSPQLIKLDTKAVKLIVSHSTPFLSLVCLRWIANVRHRLLITDCGASEQEKAVHYYFGSWNGLCHLFLLCVPLNTERVLWELGGCKDLCTIKERESGQRRMSKSPHNFSIPIFRSSLFSSSVFSECPSSPQILSSLSFLFSGQFLPSVCHSESFFLVRLSDLSFSLPLCLWVFALLHCSHFIQLPVHNVASVTFRDNWVVAVIDCDCSVSQWCICLIAESSVPSDLPIINNPLCFFVHPHSLPLG